MIRFGLAAFGLLCLIGAGCDGVTGKSKVQAPVGYNTERAVRGVVSESVSATGTLEPVELVDIGAQVSGKILFFGKDLEGETIDYCSVVTNGMLLAKIDDVTYLADLDVAKAQLRRAEASVAVAMAQARQAAVSRDQASREWERAQKIGVGSALSQTAYEQYRSTFENAEAALTVSEAQVKQSEAAVIEAKASLEKAERNLSYCDIVSSVDGVVIDRRVNVGQTVVSSMSASSLFLVARDLSKMQVWVAVNEADIGTIKEGTPVSFTVDTFPGRSFTGVVRRIRLNATMTSNVVTYIVEVDTDNGDRTLVPYLTANVLFETAREDGGLVVPAKALRFAPAGEANGGDAVYVLNRASGALRRVDVKVLLSNGLDAAVTGDGLREGDEVVTSVIMSAAGKSAAAPEGSSNPFMPNMPKPPKGARPPAP